MINDKGFSRIISVIIVIVIIILIGVVISISSTKDNKPLDLVDVIENDFESVETENNLEPSFIGFNVSASGYKIVKQNLDNESEVIIERADGQYTLLTSSINQDSVLIIKSFWQDKKNGAKELFELNLGTGEVKKVFSLLNFQIDNKRKFIAGAVYSTDRQKIAYSTNLYDEEQPEMLEVGSASVEIWEYDINKDMHTLITNISGGLYSNLKLLGYDNSQENIIMYQFNIDAEVVGFGRVYFVNIKKGIVDKESFQLTLDNYFSQTKETADRIKTVGYPYLSPMGDYIAFILPSLTYQDDLQANNNEVVLYNIGLHQIISIYVDDTVINEGVSNPILSNLYWVNNYLYIPTPTQLIMYGVKTNKLRSVYMWSDKYEYYELFTITDNSVLIKTKTNIAPIYIDFITAIESELVGMENFEYINIYYK